MKQRLLLCLLLTGVMLYYAIPRLTLESGDIQSVFAGMWLLLAIFAAAGNLSGILYSPWKQKRKKNAESKQVRKRIHYYH
jgi:hypothetical protein